MSIKTLAEALIIRADGFASPEDVAKAIDAHITERLRGLAPGEAGTGACICKISPEAFVRHCDHLQESPKVARGVMSLDHRCPHHGEKAQPVVWGRHKEKELCVTWAQWDSLGVRRESK